jgi:hypothetical protein
VSAELDRPRDAAEYLSGDATPLPAGFKTPDALAQYENSIPDQVRRVAKRADKLARAAAGQTSIDRAQQHPRRPNVWWFFAVPRRRKHRATGMRKGPRPDYAGLARAVYKLIADRGMIRADAERYVARSLFEPAGITEKSARARIRRALRRLG